MNDAIRKSPVHMPPLWKDSKSPLIFLTVCTNDRKKILASNLPQTILEFIWTKNANPAAWLVGKYVLMPDHIHLFCAPGYESTSLESWVRYWKSRFTKICLNHQCNLQEKK